MKKTHLIFSSVIALTCAINALHASTPPTSCPSASAIVSKGLLSAERDEEEGGFEVGQISSYGTQHTWGFVIMVPFYMASNESEAIQKATQALPALNANFTTPIYQDGMYVCLYTANGLQAGAVTPLPLNNVAKKMQFNQ